MNKIWLLLGIFLFVPFVGRTADYGVVARFDAGGVPVEVRRDAAGVVQFDGLPYPGLVLYRPETGVVYYQHPADPQWISLGAADAAVAGVPVKLEAGTLAAAWQGQAVRRWRIHTGAEGVSEWFASVGLARQIGMTAHDLTKVLAVLEWMTSGAASGPQARAMLDAAQGVEVGFPTQWPTPNGVWVLKELVKTPVATLTLPHAVQPLNENLRLNMLLSQFGPDERAAFLAAHARVPVSVQLEQLETALTQGYDAPRD